jgi:drug/metabolite transporter (DMT)-like permease
MAHAVSRGRLLAAFAAIYVLWGSTYLAVAVSVQSIPPFLLMAARSLAAGAILFAMRQLPHREIPSARAWAIAAIAGILLFLGCHGTLAYAQTHVPSGVAAVILATIPFWIVLIELSIPIKGRPRVATLIGLLPGIAGVLLIAWRGGTVDTIAPTMILLLLGSSLAWAVGSLISQRAAATTDALTLSAMELLCGGAMLFVASWAVGELAAFSPARVSPSAWAGLAYLTVAGSVVAFSAYVWLLDHIEASLVATYTFVNPIIAILLGWVVLGEELTLRMLLGFALVIGSVVAVWQIDRRRDALTSRRSASVSNLAQNARRL